MLKQLIAVFALFWFVFLLGGCAFHSQGNVTWNVDATADLSVPGLFPADDADPDDGT